MLPSSSSQSEDIANLPGESLHNGVHIAQYLESFLAFVEAVDEGGDGVLSTNWLPCMGARFVNVLCATSITSWVRLLPVVDFQLN